MTIRQVISKNPIAYQTIVRNLIVPCEIHYRTNNAFNAYQVLHYAEDEKAGSGIGKVCFQALARSMYPHLTEWRIFFEVGYDDCFVQEIRQTTSRHLE